MKRRVKKLLSLVLALTMMIPSVGNTVYATESNEPVVAAEATLEPLTESTAYVDPSKPADGTTEKQPFVANVSGGSRHFRIPALITGKDGALIAAADARWNHIYDYGGLDTIVSYSTNNGETWNYTMANYFGDNGNVAKKESSTFIDPQLVYAPNVGEDGTIFMLVDLFAGGHATYGDHGSIFPLSGSAFVEITEQGEGDTTITKEYLRLRPSGTAESDDSQYIYYLKDGFIYQVADGAKVAGYKVDEYFNLYVEETDGSWSYSSNLFFSGADTTGKHAAPKFMVYPTTNLWLVKSTDNGATWSAPQLLDVKRENEAFCGVAPGRGLVTKDGTIILSCYSLPGKGAASLASFIYSTDGGKSWKRTSDATQSSFVSTENQIVELADGTLRMFFRNRKKSIHYVDATKQVDANGQVTGYQWSEPVNTNISNWSWCQISAMMYSEKIDGKDAILVACPSDTSEERMNGKIFVGLINSDNTMDWSKYSYPINQTYFQYSCMTELNDGSIGIVYEEAQSGQDASITYKNIKIEDIVKNATIGDLWVKDANDAVVKQIKLRPTNETTLTVGGMLLNDTVTPSITWTATDVADVTLEGRKLKIAAKAAGTGVLAVTDGTNTLEIEIEVTTTTYKEEVTLRIGDTVTVTDDKGYYVGTQEVQDASVAGVEVSGTVEDSYATVGNDSQYNNGTIALEDNLYTFTSNTFVIESSVVDNVYLSHRETSNAGFANSNTITDITVGECADGTFTLMDNGTGTGGKYLVFMRADYTFDRNGDVANNNDRKFDTYFELYAPLAEGEEAGESPIAGYKKLNKGSEIKVDGQYLIAHIGEDGKYYVLYPGVGTSNKYDYVAQVSEGNVIRKTSSGFNGETKPLSECLFTFKANTKPESFTRYYISADANGSEVYLNFDSANTGIPQKEAAASGKPVQMNAQADGTWKLNEGGSNLHFERDSSDNTFNRCPKDCDEDKFEIYVKSDKAPADSAILGYQKITSAGQFVSGGQYLIAARVEKNADYDGVYLLHPSSDTSNKYTHVAKVTDQRPVAQVGEETVPSVVFEGGEIRDLSELLYTFKVTAKNGATGYSIYSENEDGNPRLYLSLRNDKIKPHKGAGGAESLFTIQYHEATKTFLFNDKFGGNNNAGGNLHFHSDKQSNGTSAESKNYHYFNRCSGTTIDVDDYNHRFVIYRKANDGENCTEIPGYTRLESMDAIKDGGKYLIGFNDGGTIYLLNPPSSESDGAHKHVALLTQTEVSGTTSITIAGKKVGYTEAVVGDTTYQITVKSRDENLTLKVGQSISLPGSLEQDTTVEGVVSTEVISQGTKVTSLASGGTYLIKINDVFMTSTASTSKTPHGLVLSGDAFLKETNTWTFVGEKRTLSNGAEEYVGTLQHENGQYLNFENSADGKSKVFLANNPQTLVMKERSEGNYHIRYEISDNVTTYLNNHGGSNVHATGWNSDDHNWNFETTTESVNVTGTTFGTTMVSVGGINYYIAVADVVKYQSLEEIVNYVNTNNLLTDTAYTQTSRNALDAVLTEARAMLGAKDTTEYTDETVLNTKQAEVEAMTKKVNDAVTALQKANESITLLEGKSEVVKVTAATVTKMPDTDVATVDVKTKDGIHEMTITGVNSGVTEVVIGDNTYKIYVLENPETTKVIANTGQGTGLPVNRLTISADASFDLNIKGNEAATFSIDPVYAADGTTNIVAISEDGIITVTDQSAVTTVMETVVTVTVGEEVFKVPVYIRPGATAAAKKILDLHITEIKNTEVYYSWNCSSDLNHGYVGETFYVNYNKDASYAIDFMGAPHEGHALNQLIRENESQGAGDGHYMLVHNGDHKTLDTSEAGFLNYTKDGNPGAGIAQTGMYGLDTVKKMLYAGVTKGVDGIFGFTRNASGKGNNIYNLTFRSEKLPTIEKEVAGLLPQDGKVGEYRKYTEGMTGAEGEYVYFKVNVKSYRPLELNAEKKSNITYSNMKITDTALASASFVTPEFDANGNLVNVDADDMNPTTIVQQITDEINAAVSADVWSDENEETKDHVYYLVYKIEAKDVGNTIENTALLDYRYKSHYSKGVYDVSAQAVAEVGVSDYKTKNIVVDFGLPVTVHIETWGKDGVASDKLLTGEGVGKASYGKVDVAGDRENGWTITYTPTRVLQGVDNVVLTAEDGVTKYSVKVYPANSVYYEGSFMSEVSGEWETKGSLPTGLQQTAELGDAGKGTASNYGYDAIYAEELKVPAVTVRSDSTVKDIKECLYTFENTGRTYTLDGKDYPIYDISAINADGTKVYLNVGKASQSGNQSPNQLDSTGMIVANRGEQLLSIIGINLPTGISDTTRAYLHCTYSGPHFDRCSTDPSDHANNHAFELYQYTGNQDDGLVIPGYERVSDGSKIKHGEQYLIVFKRPDNDTRYVLHPANGTTANDFTNGNKARSVATLTGTVTSDTSNTGTAMTTTNADASGAFADSLANAETTFTFTGTGVDLYAHCTKDTGIAMVIITQKNANGKDKIAKVMMVDTQLRTGSVDTAAGLNKMGMTNNVPFVSLPANSLTYGTYEVAIVHATSKVEQNSGQVDENGKEIKTRVSVPTKLNLDGFRVYGTLTAADEARYYAGDCESGMQYKDVRDALLAAWNVGDVWNKEDDKSVYAEQLAENTLSQIYAATGQKLTGAFLLDNNSQQMAYTGADLKDYLDNSSKNEVYLYPGQSLVFTLESSNVNPQIALKSLNGSVQYTMTAGASDSTATITTPEPQTMRSNTEMYYPLAMAEVEDTPVKTTFTITNAGTSGVLAITKFKAIDANGAVDFAAVTEKDLTMALISLGFKSETQQPEVTAEPTVTEVPETTEEPTETPDSGVDVTKAFSDVHNDWYTDYVSFVYANGLMTGIKGTTEFQPNANITKAQVAQVLYNMENNPLPLNDEVFHVLSDVYDSEWYADAVSWAYSTGIVTGDLNTKKFSPNADVTREQLALMFYRYAEYKKYETKATSDFAGLENADLVADWSETAVRWAVGSGLISGIEKDGVKDLAPQGNATRAQMAAILQRFCENCK